MHQQLVLYATGAVEVPREDKAVAAKAKDLWDTVRFTGFALDGVLALGAHAVTGMNSLVDHAREVVSTGDPLAAQVAGHILQMTEQTVVGIIQTAGQRWVQ